MTSRRWQRFAALCALWTVPPLALTAGLFTRADPPPVSWSSFLAFQLLQWWPWALLTPLIGALRRRWPLMARSGGGRGAQGGPRAPFRPRTDRSSPYRVREAIGVHLAVAAIVGFLLTAAQVAAELAISDRSAPVGEIVASAWQVGRGTILFQVVIYVLVLGVFEALALYRHDREREERLAHARLRALQFQLQPHFLFNTLHAISSLMDEDVAAARRMIARLSDLLRASLDAERPVVPLRQELETARRYLEIEEVRFEDRLRVTWEVDPDVLDAEVPHLVLQPLLENAIRHGVSRLIDAGCLTVRARNHQGVVEVLVDDDGPGLSARGDGGPDPTNGIGLSNTRARLAALYGAAASLELCALQPRGARAIVRLPYRAGEGGQA